jgi:hypothetical protein
MDENPKLLPVPRHLYTLFADDLRQEVSGKTTMVGIYQAQMLVSQLPITIPKLAVLMMAITPIEKPFQKLTFVLLKDNELFQSYDISPDVLVPPKNLSQEDANESHVIEIQMGAIISPLVLEEECILRSQIITEEGIMAGRSLRVSRNPVSSAIEAAPVPS